MFDRMTAQKLTRLIQARILPLSQFGSNIGREAKPDPAQYFGAELLRAHQ